MKGDYAMNEGTNTAATLASIVTAEMIQGVLDQILALLPVLLPALIGFIAVRKGISFLLGSLRSA